MLVVRGLAVWGRRWIEGSQGRVNREGDGHSSTGCGLRVLHGLGKSRLYIPLAEKLEKRLFIQSKRPLHDNSEERLAFENGIQRLNQPVCHSTWIT